MRRNSELRQLARQRLDNLRSTPTVNEAQEIERLRKQGCIVMRVPGCTVVIQKYADEAPTP